MYLRSTGEPIAVFTGLERKLARGDGVVRYLLCLLGPQHRGHRYRTGVDPRGPRAPGAARMSREVTQWTPDQRAEFVQGYLHGTELATRSPALRRLALQQHTVLVNSGPGSDRYHRALGVKLALEDAPAVQTREPVLELVP